MTDLFEVGEGPETLEPGARAFFERAPVHPLYTSISSFWNSCGHTNVKPCGTAYFGWKPLGFLLVVFLYVPVFWLMLKFMLPAVVHKRRFPAGLWLEQLEVWGRQRLREFGGVYVVGERLCIFPTEQWFSFFNI